MTASPAGAETTLTVAAGHGGAHLPGRQAPLRVEVAADRRIDGTVVASLTAEPGYKVSLPVEVPGASVKVFHLTVPTPPTRATVTVQVDLRAGGRTVASTRSGLQATADQELVGLLPGALAGRTVPGTAPLSVDAGTARFVALDEIDLGRAPAGIDSLSTIGAAAGELGRLPGP
ncbi:MAG: hypothetical protein ACRD0F_06130, partial [Acidimicrobiales bacterium]